jgi:hypothetical protein
VIPIGILYLSPVRATPRRTRDETMNASDLNVPSKEEQYTAAGARDFAQGESLNPFPWGTLAHDCWEHGYAVAEAASRR